MRWETLYLRHLERFRNLDGTNPEGLWLALGKLVSFLGDHLVLVDKTALGIDQPCRLVVFTALDPDRTPLYVVVTQGGAVVVGRCDRLGYFRTMDLKSFDPLWHEVTSVAVTDRGRHVGDRLDLWIGVRRSPRKSDAEPEIVAYHGLVWLGEDGEPRVVPARDDQEAGDGDWRPGSAARLPPWFSTWNVTTMANPDLHTDLPEAAEERIGAAQRRTGLEVTAVAWEPKAVCFTIGEEIEFVRLYNPWGPWRMPLGEQAAALTFTLSPQGQGLGVLAFEAPYLIAFTAREGTGLTESWSQSRDKFPAALAFLPAAEDPDPRAQGSESERLQWPDLLVANADGHLERLHYVGEEAIRETWGRCWKQLGLEAAEERIAAARERSGRSPGQRSAALLGAVEQVLCEAQGATPEVRRRWLGHLTELFRPEESSRVLLPGVNCLLRALERLAAANGQTKAPPAVGSFVPGLLYQIYSRKLPVLIREQVDRSVRAIDWPSGAQPGPYVKKLISRSQRGRIEIWQRGQRRKVRQRIDHAAFALERWASAYLQSDTSRLHGMLRRRVSSAIAGIPARTSKSDPWLAVADQKQVKLLTIEKGKLALKEPFPHRLLDDVICGLEHHSVQEGDRLLALGRGGFVYLLVPEGGAIALTDRLDLSAHGPAWAMASCQHVGDGSRVVAVILGRHRSSTLALCRVRGRQIRKLWHRDLDLPWVRTADLCAVGGSEYLLAIGANQAAPVGFYRLDLRRGIVERRWFRTLESGTTAVRFSSRRYPHFALAGERNGLLWCADLRAEPGTADLCWIHQLDSAIRNVEAVTIDGEPHFLIGPESGKLALLRASDGRRVWKEALHKPIRRLVKIGEDGALVVVVMVDGWVDAFVQLGPEEQEEALKAARKDLAALHADPKSEKHEAWRLAEVDSVKAFASLEQAPAELTALFERFRSPETRGRILRILALHRTDPPAEAAEMLRLLTFRDLRLFLSYLPDDEKAWAELIAEELRRRRPKGAEGAAAAAAMVTYLQREGRHNPTVAELLRLCPDEKFFDDLWFRLEFARLLVQAVERERRGDHEQGTAAALLSSLFDAFFCLRPGLVADTARVVAYESELEKDLRAFRELLDALAEEAAASGDYFQRLASRLRPEEVTSEGQKLLATLVQLHGLVSRHRNDPWVRWRRQALDALGEVARRSRRPFSVGPAGDMVTALRSLLEPRPIPGDQEPLEDRILWVEQARRRLERPRPQPEGSTAHPWHALTLRFLDLTREIVNRLWANERAHLMELVRPRLSLLRAQHDGHNQLRLRLRAEAEGERDLNDVSIVFDARGKDGLRPPGNTETRIHELVYPGRSPTHEMVLQGYIVPGQRTVTVRVTLRDRNGYQCEDRWPIEIPAPPSRVAGRLPDSLPRTYRRFCDAVFESAAPVALAVIDGDTGRDAFLDEWQARFPGRMLDLDAALRDFGRGRRYANQALDLALIEETIAAAIPDRGRSDKGRSQNAVPPFLVGPTGEVVQRLLDGGEESLLERWLASLRRRAEERESPRLVIVVSSVHGSRLRGMEPGPIAELSAHRLVGDDSRSEATALIEKETGLSTAEARQRLEALGGDLRLVLRWLDWVRDSPDRARKSVRPFLETDAIAELLRSELASLPAFSLICALVGSEAETALETSQVVPGYFSARDYLSTTRTRAAKRLVAAGAVITGVILDRIRSDRSPPPQLRIQGLGRRGTPVARRSKLLGVVNSRPWAVREEAFRQLAGQEIGTFHHEIFRTASPYREFIRTLYDRTASSADEHRDGEVYAALLGKGRSPAEAVTVTDLLNITVEDLRRLMPNANKDDLRTLRRLARFTREPGEEDLDSLVTALFRPETVRPLEPDANRWDQPLTSLDMPVFGVGELPGLEESKDPETFVVWVADAMPDVVRIISQAAREAKERRQKMELEEIDSRTPVRRTPRVFLLGPGVEDLKPDPARRVAILRLDDVCHAAWGGKLSDGLRRRARGQLRLTAFSPFQINGALLPGSRLFVGREEELEFISTRIREVSIMIVGGRRVGKTSLLNQVYHWARSESDLEPIRVDLQGVKKRPDFLAAVAGEWKKAHLGDAVKQALRTPATDARTYLRNIAEAAEAEGRLAIFLLNEIDRLVENDPDLVEVWRGLNDEGLARFLMVGYSVIGRLGAPDSPVFHFTEGNRFGGKAMAPTALSRDAAEELMKQLTASELDLHWRSELDRKQAIELLLERSYRIPWVLQRYGQLLVERLETQRTDEIALAHVEHVLAKEGPVVWQYIDGIDYQGLGFQGTDSARRPGFQLVLFALARKYYFLGGREAPIGDPRLPLRPALDLGFTVGEARQAVKEAVAELLVEKEREVLRWFDQLDLRQALRLLTLTLTLEPDPAQNDRYGFLLHILPLELHRLYGKADPTLDDLITNTTIELLRLLTG